MLFRTNTVPIYHLVGETGEFIGRCNKLDGGSQVLQKHRREKFYAGLETREGFLEEVTYELHKSESCVRSSQTQDGMEEQKEGKRHTASGHSECKSPQ